MRQVVHPHTWEPGLLLGPFAEPLLWFGREGGTFWHKGQDECSDEKNMHFQHSILTSNQPMTIIFCSHFIIFITSFSSIPKFSKQFLRDSFLFRAEESVGLFLPGEMLFCEVKNLFFLKGYMLLL